MNYSNYTDEQLIERIDELEMLSSALLKEKEQESKLDFAWAGNLGHWYWNLKTNTVICNKLKITTLGYTVEEVPKTLHYQFFTEKLHPDDYQNTMDAMLMHMQGKAPVYEVEYRIQAKDKSWKWFYDRGMITQRDCNGKPEFISGIVFDVTARKEQELDLAKENERKYTDELTDGANRTSFKCIAERLIADHARQYAYCVIDIDKFNQINETFGRIQGDLFIKHIAKTLLIHTEDHEEYAHFSGGKFHILLTYMGKEMLGKRLDCITEGILSYPFAAEPHINIVVCIGICIVGDTGISVETISDRANVAAAMNKGSYTSGHYYYDDDVHNRIKNDNEIENEMNKAFLNKDFKVFIQPKYNLKTQKIDGAEALIRWQHPDKGMILPGEFIPLFERNGFVTKIDMYVFEEVCKKQKQWLREGWDPIIISVNQSRLHLQNPAYVDTLQAIIKKYGIQTGTIELELTESVFTSNFDIINVTRRLHTLGFRISIDDFGTGYSSLNMLKDVCVDVVKLDREFINGSSDTLRGKMIIKNIIWMSKDLGLETVAEGIETKEQAAFFREIGCDLAQGYYFAKPMPIAAFEDLMRNVKDTGSLTPM